MKDFKGIVRFNIDFDRLINKQGNNFYLEDEVQLPRFRFQSHMDGAELKKEQANHRSEIQNEKLKDEKQSADKIAKQQEKEVKCLCVHGKCPKGSWKCDRCDDGWEGTLCDMPIKAKNINRKDTDLVGPNA